MGAEPKVADLITELHALSANGRTSELRALARDAANALDDLARKSPSYEALEIIARSVASALERAGVTECDDPGESIDVMREEYERKLAALARQEPAAWAKSRPTLPGAYKVRGWNLDAGRQLDEALVTVAVIDGELCSDLNECNTGRCRDWMPLNQHRDDFEWLGPLSAAPPAHVDLLRRAVPFLRDEGSKYEDDGSNEPLDLARDIESLIDQQAGKGDRHA